MVKATTTINAKAQHWRWLTVQNMQAEWGKLRPILRTPVIFKYEMKAQTPGSYVNLSLSLPNLHLHCHHSLTDNIFKERDLWVSVTLVRPRVDSNLLSEQCFWEVWCLFCSRLPPSLYSHRNLGMRWTCSPKLECLHLNFGGHRSMQL